MLDYLLSLAAYNTWANKKIAILIAAAGEERSTTEQVSSFTTILSTILHILNAQSIWMSRLHGVSPLNWPPEKFTGSSLDASAHLVSHSQEFEVYVASLQHDELNKKINYQNMKGEQFSSTVSQILTHVMNHGTFHRGQLITMLRVTGMTELASTDMIAFYRETTV